MSTTTLLLFAMTVLPLVCTPGPDILFVASQGLTGGHPAALRANAGILTGYGIHALLAAFGVAALITAWPPLLHAIRAAGLVYLLWLALQMFRSAMRHGTLTVSGERHARPFARGMLTSLLNPKGLLIYLSILPNFIHPAQAVAPQALALSAMFIGSCAVVYGLIGASAANVGRRGTLSDRKRRLAEASAGSLLLLAAGKLAS